MKAHPGNKFPIFNSFFSHNALEKHGVWNKKFPLLKTGGECDLVSENKIKSNNEKEKKDLIIPF